ncbi:hypothetical protein SAMN05421866_4170 [Chryseobacterium oranimense]|uniref:Uncharacterized protein n=1 Tax=Chryseobacterium oranimense TaxID=421058 RepID=A0A1M5WPH4_9FLAO|nr:hypothetical protein SAMN05421866_4170 [Chryseobacterium oranimense]
MDFIIKLLHSLFFGVIFFIAFINYEKEKSIKPLHFIVLLLCLAVLIYLDTNYSVISNKLLFLLLIFSLSIVVLNLMKGFIHLEKNSLLKNNDYLRNNYKNVKKIFFSKIIPMMIFLYQLLIIWFPNIFEKMSQK